MLVFDPLAKNSDICDDNVMMRTKQQLEASRDELKYMVRRLQKEIELIEADIASLGAEIRLDDKFFWERLAPILLGATSGLTTSYMLRTLQTGGLDISPGNFRTFISRYGQRGLLEASGSGRALQWRLSAGSAEQARRNKEAAPE